MTPTDGKRGRLGERQVVEAVGISVTELRVWCDAGWVAPAPAEGTHGGGQSGEDAGGDDAGGEYGAVFDEVDLARIRLLRELRDDLGLDAEAIPVVLSLLDQLYGVRRELRALAAAVDRQDPAVAARIRDAYRRLAED